MCVCDGIDISLPIRARNALDLSAEGCLLKNSVHMNSLSICVLVLMQ